MWKNPKAVFDKKPNFEKLLAYNFVKQENCYLFSCPIMDGMFLLTISVTENGATQLEVMDEATNEEYSLVYVTGSVGSFVGNVRAQCENILNDIVDKCYEPHIFKSENAKLVIQYMWNNL